MPHYDKHYDKELQDIKNKVLALGELVEEQITRSISALKEHDTELAKEVIHNDHKVNGKEVEIDEDCITLIALRQPQGPDLRFVATAIKIINDLERMGDLAVNIAERVLDLAKEEKVKEYIDIPRMAEIAVSMTKKSLEALVTGDTKLANEVRMEDDMVDSLNRQIFRELLSYMNEKPKLITPATSIMFVSKYIERIADHATNIAEMVVYMVEGKIIRHTEPEEV